jgi:hypothetical protein
MQLALTDTVARIVTRMLVPDKMQAAAREQIVDSLTAVLSTHNVEFLPEGCPSQRLPDATKRCIDLPTVQYLHALAAEHLLRGDFRLAFPRPEADADISELVRLGNQVG